MSIIGPIIYIWGRIAKGDILMTALIYLGYDWRKEEMIARKRLHLVLIIAFL